LKIPKYPAIFDIDKEKKGFWGEEFYAIDYRTRQDYCYVISCSKSYWMLKTNGTAGYLAFGRFRKQRCKFPKTVVQT